MYMYNFFAKLGIISALVVCGLMSCVFAQPVDLPNWSDTPKLHTLTADESTTSSIILQDKRVLQYAYQDDGLFLYETVHKIVRLNDDKALEMFNKVFVPMSNVIKFVEIKARAIGKDGKVTEVNQKNIKELENVRDLGNFKIFAIEGAEAGGEIEYLYTTLNEIGDFYGRETFQTTLAPIREATFSLISPQSLVFESKGYNGFPELKAEEKDSIRILSATASQVPVLREEQYSLNRANLMRVTYKLLRHTERQNLPNLYSWKQAAESFSSMMYSSSPTAAKAVQKVLKTLKINKKSADEKVIAIEQYLKNTIALEDGVGANFTDVEQILNNKYANELGMARAFAAFLTEAGVDHQVVVTSSRFESKFDKDFEDWNNFTKILFYVPQSQKYIAPADIQFRYGAPPYECADNYGLFITPATQAWAVNYIPVASSEDNQININAHVTFDTNFKAQMQMEQSWSGYRAAEFRTINGLQKDFIRQLMLSGLQGAQVSDIKLTNEALENSAYPDRLFAADAQISVESLTEKAGKNYLFKIGEMIGGQVELYQEHARQNPIDMQHPTYYRRKITFEVPKGYHLQGLEDVKIDKFLEDNGKKVCRFYSDYTTNGDTVTVTADEYYDQTSFSKEQYEAFRKVINAAADFNKVVLVFEKQ